MRVFIKGQDGSEENFLVVPVIFFGIGELFRAYLALEGSVGDNRDQEMSEATAAIEELYQAELPALLRYFVASRMGREVAEDLAQDTFKEAVRHPERIVAAESPRAYLFGIARNLRRRFYRGLKVTVPLEEQSLANAAEEIAPEDPRIEKLQVAMLQLDNLHREILELRLYQDLRYAEIAEVLSIPIGTVRSRIHHSIAKLRTILTED